MFVKSKETRLELAGAIKGMLDNGIKVNKLDVLSKLTEPLQMKASLLKITGDDIVLDVKEKCVSIKKTIVHSKPMLVFVKDSACNSKSTIMMNELACNLKKALYETNKKPLKMSGILSSFFSNSDNFDYSFVIALRHGLNPLIVTGNEATIVKMRNETIRFHDSHNLLYLHVTEVNGELLIELFDINNSPIENETIDSLSEYLSRHGIVKLNKNQLMEVV